MHEKRRLELIIENMALSRACNVLQEAGLTGYTVLPAVAGFGGSSAWKGVDDLSDTREMAVVIAIGDEARIERALQALHSLLEAHIGVLSVGTVELLRAERF